MDGTNSSAKLLVTLLDEQCKQKVAKYNGVSNLGPTRLGTHYKVWKSLLD